MNHVLLLLQLFFVAIICSGQSVTDFSGSGDGDEEVTVEPVTDPPFIPPPFDLEEFLRQLLLGDLCSRKPDVCENSPSVCPCGSVQETILHPIIFYVIQFLPCNRISSTEFTFRECDTFTQYAALVAFDGLQELESLEYLYYQCFDIKAFISQPESIPTHTYGLFHDGRGLSQTDLLGAVGLNNPDTLEIFHYLLSEVYKKLTISYYTSQRFVDNRDEYPYFYSTVPPPSFFTRVILKLLSDFGWFRVGIVSSSSEFHLRNTELLLKLAFEEPWKDNFTVLFTTAYNEDSELEAILQRFKDDDFRIFVANIESSKARNLFCQASRENLTTEQHLWILPSFYDYKWWEGPTECDSKDKNCCTNKEILDASVGTIFIGDSTLDYYSEDVAENAVRQIFDKVYNESKEQIYGDFAAEDRLFLLHSRTLYVYDAILLYAVAFNTAIRNLTLSRPQNITEAENKEFCDSLVTPLIPNTTNILTEKMDEILKSSAFCGYSGYHILGNSNTVGQAWITQLQYYEDCERGVDLGNFVSDNSTGCYKESDIGRYANFDKPNKCEYLTLEPINASDFKVLEFEDFQFKNSCCHQISDLISPRPYLWKGENPWKHPTDGACYGDSCKCLNQLGPPELAVGFVITVSGLFLCCVLILLNCLLRKNKHIKASSPRFNIILIVNCMVMYLVPVFTSLLLSGNYFNGYKTMIPVSCEIVKWISNVGLTLILSTMVCRNWRIYRIFYNPRIKERRFLSDSWIVLFMIALVIPVILITIGWTVLDGYRYNLYQEEYMCPNVIVDDSIKTYRVTHRCIADNITLWEGVILVYDFLLGALLIFLAYQNSSIASHFAEEGEFASRAMFFITLFLIPTFALSLIVNDSDNSLNIRLYFWSKVGYGTLFPTLLLIGLYVPKFIDIVRDKQISIRERKTIRVQYSLQQEYESKVNEIGELRSRLKSLRQESTGEITLTGYDTRHDSFSTSPYDHHLRSSGSVAYGRPYDHRDSSFNGSFTGGLDHRNSAITSTVFSFHDTRKSQTPSPSIALHSKRFFPPQD